MRLALLLPLALMFGVVSMPERLGLSFPDPDDAMRLVQVRDLVAGQGWFDLTPYRLDPPQTLPIHWSRLADAPLAAIILLVRPFFGSALAETAALLIWPPLLLGVFALVAALLARRLGGQVAMPAAALLVFGASVLWQFIPGRIDHHALQAILGLAALAFALARESRAAARLAGIFTGAALAVGLDTAAVLGFVGLLFASDVLLGRDRGASVAAYTTGAAVTLSAAFLLTVHPAYFTVSACDGPTGRIVLTALGALLILRLSAVFLQGKGPAARVLVFGAAAALGVGLVLGLAPSCLRGLAGAADHEAVPLWLQRVEELSSMTELLQGPGEWVQLQRLVFPCLGLAGVATIAVLSPRRRRTAVELGLCLSILTVIGWMAIRGLFLANALAIGPIAAAAALLLRRAGPAAMPAAVRAMCAATVIVFTTFAMSAAFPRPSPPSEAGAADAPPAQAASAAVDVAKEVRDAVCNAAADHHVLAALPTGLVLAPIWNGPMVLVFTPHSVVSAGYHRFRRGNDFGEAAMNGTVENARRAVRERGVDYVALCRVYPALGPFIAALKTTPPDWLEPASRPGDELLVFRVRKEAH